MSGPITKERKLKDGAKLPAQFRDLNISLERMLDEDKRTLELSFSSEEPVDRWFGQEILDHGDGVDLSRLENAAAFLKDHDLTKQIGVVESAWIENGRGHAVVRFSKGELGQAEFDEVRDGIRTKISFGYRIKKMILEEGNEDAPDVYRATEWMPYEISTVSVPADDTVGIGRSQSGDEFPVAIEGLRSVEPSAPATAEPAATPKPSPTEPTRSMDPNEQPGGAAATTPAPAADRAAILKEERERQREFRAIGERFGIKPDDVQRALDSDLSLDGFRKQVMSDFDPASLPAPKADLRTGMPEKDLRQFSILKAIREIGSGGSLSGVELEVAQEVAKRNPNIELDERQVLIPLEILNGRRDLEVGTDAEGGYTVETNLGSMIDLLRNKMVCANSGATMLNGLRGNLSLPKHAGGATAGWVDEEGTISDSAQSFGQLALTPKRLAARTAYSNQLLAQSSIDTEQFVRGDLMRVIAIELDRAALNGSGASNQPTGIINTSGVNSVTFGAAPTWAKVVSFETEVETDNGVMNSPCYVTTPGVKGAWKTTLKSSGVAGYLWEGSTVNGYEAKATNQVPSNKVIFGDFSELIIATWGVMSVVVDPFTKAASGQQVITVNSFHDIGVRNPVSFAVSSDAGNQ